MRRYEWWAIALIVAYVAVTVATPLHALVAGRLFSTPEIGELTQLASVSLLTRTLLGLVINVVVAVWLFRLAKRDHASPWVWAMFGLFFSVLGAVLYFGLQIYQRLRHPDHCHACGRDLAENIRQRETDCPDCGAPILVRTP